MSELKLAVEKFRENPDSKIKLHGLMTMATLRAEDYRAEARRCFKLLREVSQQILEEEEVKLELSMGMSRDYHIAMEEECSLFAYWFNNLWPEKLVGLLIRKFIVPRVDTS